MKYLSAEPTKVSDISSSDFVGVSRSKEGRETEFSLLRLPSVKKNTKEGGEKIQTESDLTEVSPPMVKRSKRSEHALQICFLCQGGWRNVREMRSQNLSTFSKSDTLEKTIQRNPHVLVQKKRKGRRCRRKRQSDSSHVSRLKPSGLNSGGDAGFQPISRKEMTTQCRIVRRVEK